MMKRTIETFRGFTEDCLYNAKEKGIIYGVGTWKIGDIKNTSSIQYAYEKGKGI